MVFNFCGGGGEPLAVPTPGNEEEVFSLQESSIIPKDAAAVNKYISLPYTKIH